MTFKKILEDIVVASDLDKHKLVRHSRYSEIAVGASAKLFPEIGDTFMVKANQERIRIPLAYGNKYSITSKIDNIGNTSVSICYRLTRDESILYEAKITYVKAVNGQSEPITKGERARLYNAFDLGKDEPSPVEARATS
jgi:acyl-CoA thioesterase FadM